MTSKFWNVMGLAIVAASLAACSEDAGSTPSLGVPYDTALEASIQVDNVYVASGYGDMGSTPFGNAHLGIHYSPTAAHNADMEYYAMADGTIGKIESLVSAGKYNVNVQQTAGNATIVYQFETESAVAADGTAQLGKIAVSEGQSVSKGDLIGTLHDAGAPNPIMHIGVIQDDLMCPATLMNADAIARTDALIARDNPTWQACYGD